MPNKNLMIYDLKKWTLDDGLHIDFREIDGYNKPFNYIVCSRSAGKSVQLWKKIYNRFKATGEPSIVLRRKIVDITEQYVSDIATLINKFTDNDIEFEFKKGDIKQGMLDVRLNGEIFFRVIALSAPMNRLKSMVLRNVAYMVFDEYIANLNMKEKYEDHEVMRFQEVYNTYNREAKSFIKCYFCGNPYSLYNPYFTWHKVPTRQLKKGALLTGRTWLVWCYELKQELKDYLLRTNPLYEDTDSDYVKYAFDGEAINDRYKQILEVQPEGYKLVHIFKIQGQVLGVFKDFELFMKRPANLIGISYWVRILNADEISKYRDILTFDFSEMMNQTILVNKIEKSYLQELKEAIQYRAVAYKTLDASYLMEEIYVNL